MTARHHLVHAVAIALVAVAAPACGDGAASGEVALRAALATSAGKGGEVGALAPVAVPLRAASPHRMTLTATIALELPGGARTVTVSRTIDRGAAGRFRVADARTVEEPGRDALSDARDGVYDGERFASRRGVGPWVERDVLRGGHWRFLADAYALGEDVLRGFKSYLVAKEDPASDETLAGMPVRWSALSLDARVRPQPLSDAELAALRDHETNWVAWLGATHRPTKVSGAVARAKETGELVAGKVEIAGEATVEGTRAPFRITVEQKVTALPEGTKLALPDDVLPAARPRTWKMIEEVLGDDLLAPYTRR
ncbi:MAG: hypothetical protein KC635_02355 [Myxococcales bacterium]|nr:hypothetical protein [Myxococcales bacterium]